MAQLSGPITGGAHGWPLSTTLVNLTDHGYVEEEFFIEGEAPIFRLKGDELRFDGRWEVEKTAEAPFKTRILVRRPLDPARFNGTVIMVWNNVSLGSDMFNFDTPEILDGGYVAVLVSAQAVGIHGYSGPNNLGMATWDPERYGTLRIPTDDASYEIFSTAASLVGPDRDTTGIDPLRGLKVDRLIATGSSQASARLQTYWNALQPHEMIFDAFLLDTHFGWSGALQTGIDQRPADMNAMAAAFQPVTMLRDDIDTPMLVANTETEARTFYPVRRPDTDLFRFWEAAGIAHGPRPSMEEGLRKIQRDWGMTIPMPVGDRTPNPISTAPYRDAAIHQVHRWLTTGEAPSTAPRLDVAGDPPTIHRDEHGIATGGIRLPQVAVPLATLHGSDGAQSPVDELTGSSVPFTPEMVRALFYPDEQTYLAKLDDAIADTTQHGFLLPRDADRLHTEGAAAYRAAVHPDPSSTSALR